MIVGGLYVKMKYECHLCNSICATDIYSTDFPSKYNADTSNQKQSTHVLHNVDGTKHIHLRGCKQQPLIYQVSPPPQPAKLVTHADHKCIQVIINGPGNFSAVSKDMFYKGLMLSTPGHLYPPATIGLSAYPPPGHLYPPVTIGLSVYPPPFLSVIINISVHVPSVFVTINHTTRPQVLSAFFFVVFHILRYQLCEM